MVQKHNPIPKQGSKPVPSASTGRVFSFEFYVLNERMIKEKTILEIEAKNENEAWRKVADKLEKDTRQLQYTGNFWIT